MHQNHPLMTIGSLVNAGIDRDIIDEWNQAFGAGDHPLLNLQRIVANDPASFSWPGPNLVITGPTSAGKTFAAEMLMAHRLSSNESVTGCIYVVPLRALVEEKYARFQTIFGKKFGKDAVYPSSSDYQEYDSHIWKTRFRIVVVVYEKLLSWLLNPIISRKILGKTSLIVFDELQVISDEQRGPRVEQILTILRQYQLAELDGYEGDNEKPRRFPLRIVGLGPVPEAIIDVEEWLDAKGLSSPSDRRPDPLIEGYVTTKGDNDGDNLVVPEEVEGVRDGIAAILHSTVGITPDDRTLSLIQQVLTSDGTNEVPGNKRLLVYVSSKSKAESLARELANRLEQRDQRWDERTQDEIGLMESIPTLQVLAETLSKGVAIHHGDLSQAERKLVDRLFHETAPDATRVDVVFCTPTLAMGVNLPADYMIFHSLDTYQRDRAGILQSKRMNVMQYRNFAGRAGRYVTSRPEQHHGVALIVTELEKSQAHRELIDSLILEPVPSVEPSIHIDDDVTMPPTVLSVLGWLASTGGETNAGRIRQAMARSFATHMEKKVTYESEDLSGKWTTKSELITIAAERHLRAFADHGTLVRSANHSSAIPTYELTDVGVMVARSGVQVPRTSSMLIELVSTLPTALQDQPLVVLEELASGAEVVHNYPQDINMPRTTEQELRRALMSYFTQLRVQGYVLGKDADEFCKSNGGNPGTLALKRLTRTALAWQWMNGTPTPDLFSQRNLFPSLSWGSMLTLVDQLAWYMAVAQGLWQSIAAVQYMEQQERMPVPSGENADEYRKRQRAQAYWDMTRFERRLRFGVGEGVESLAQLRIPRWHRDLLMELWTNRRWDHPVDLLKRDAINAFPGNEFEATVKQKRRLFGELQETLQSYTWTDDPDNDMDLHRRWVRESFGAGHQWEHRVERLWSTHDHTLAREVRQVLEEQRVY